MNQDYGKHDHEIDHLLEALGAARPEGQLENRVLRRLREASPAPSRSRHLLAWSGSLAFAAVGLLAFVATRPQQPAPPEVRFAHAAPVLELNAKDKSGSSLNAASERIPLSSASAATSHPALVPASMTVPAPPAKE